MNSTSFLRLNMEDEDFVKSYFFQITQIPEYISSAKYQEAPRQKTFNINTTK